MTIDLGPYVTRVVAHPSPRRITPPGVSIDRAVPLPASAIVDLGHTTAWTFADLLSDRPPVYIGFWFAWTARARRAWNTLAATT